MSPPRDSRRRAEACELTFHCRLAWLDTEAKAKGEWRVQFDACATCARAGPMRADALRRFCLDAKLHNNTCGSAELDRRMAEAIAPVATPGPDNVRFSFFLSRSVVVRARGARLLIRALLWYHSAPCSAAL